MSPLEKYKQKDPEQKPEKVKEGKRTEKQAESLQLELEKMRTELREGRIKKKREVIKKALDAEKDKADQEEVFSGNDSEKLNKKFTKERNESYKEYLKDKDSFDLASFAYDEMTDYGFNQEIFNAKGGWLEEYQLTDTKDKLSLEEFVLQKQYEQLTAIRESMTEGRVDLGILDIYPELEGDDKKTDRKKKVTEVTKGANAYFKDNSLLVEMYLAADDSDKEKYRQQILKDFTASVFTDVDSKDAAKQAKINSLLTDLLADYQAMLTKKDQLKEFNPKMVSALMDKDMTEAKWIKLMEEENEKISKKIKEEQSKKKAEQMVMAGAPAAFSPEANYYSGVFAGEMLGKESKIIFEEIKPGSGEYRVIYPTDNGNQESLFFARKVIEGGVERTVFVFKDPLMDGTSIVDSEAFRSQINALYLDHAMNEGLKRGADYLGPGLNDVLKDKEMFSMAEKFFYPRKLSDSNLTTEDINQFKKLMLVLTNSVNSKPGEGIYGNMMPVNNRIKLINFVLSENNGQNAPLFLKLLISKTPQQLKTYSVESLMKEFGIKTNYGNY